MLKDIAESLHEAPCDPLASLGHKTGGCSNQPQLEFKLSVDKIAICAPLKAEFHGYALSCLIETQKKLDWHFPEFGVRPGVRGRYRAAVQIHIQSGELGWSPNHFLLQIGPKVHAGHFLRLEFNPALCGPGALSRLDEAL